MSQEAMKLALERLQARTDTADLDAIAALNEALAEQPAQQEPVAEVVMAAKPPKASPAWLPFKIVHAPLEWLDSAPVGTKLYTSPPAQRTWVGLTDSEISEVLGSDIHTEPSGELRFVRAIEAKLREKNT